VATDVDILDVGYIPQERVLQDVDTEMLLQSDPFVGYMVRNTGVGALTMTADFNAEFVIPGPGQKYAVGSNVAILPPDGLDYYFTIPTGLTRQGGANPNKMQVDFSNTDGKIWAWRVPNVEKMGRLAGPPGTDEAYSQLVYPLAFSNIDFQAYVGSYFTVAWGVGVPVWLGKKTGTGSNAVWRPYNGYANEPLNFGDGIGEQLVIYFTTTFQAGWTEGGAVAIPPGFVSGNPFSDSGDILAGSMDMYLETDVQVFRLDLIR
jgi:hypothetical protein